MIDITLLCSWQHRPYTHIRTFGSLNPTRTNKNEHYRQQQHSKHKATKKHFWNKKRREDSKRQGKFTSSIAATGTVSSRRKHQTSLQREDSRDDSAATQTTKQDRKKKTKARRSLLSSANSFNTNGKGNGMLSRTSSQILVIESPSFVVEVLTKVSSKNLRPKNPT